MKRRIFRSFAVFALVSALLTGCGNTQAKNDENAQTKDGVTVVHAAGNNNYYPLCFLDTDGVVKGYAVDVNKAIFDSLPQYEFQLDTASGDVLLIGLEQGTYDMLIGGYYYNEERAQKFIFPEYSGGSIEGIVTTKDHADVKSFEEAIAQGLKIAPTLSSGGLIAALNEYNSLNPDNPLDFGIIDVREDADIYRDVLNGRYDYDFANLHTYNKIIEDNPDSDFAQKLVFNNVTSVKAYDLFNKEQQELADAYNDVLKKLRDDGTLSEIYVRWFGDDVFPYLDNDKK